MRKSLNDRRFKILDFRFKISDFKIWSLEFGAWTFKPWSLLAIAALIIASCTQSEQADADTYICPMHPTVVTDRPSTCPVCGMDLVRKAREGEEVEITEDLAKLLKSPNETVVASIKTIKGVYKSIPVSLTAQGLVTYDTRNLNQISARVSGRLEKVFVKYPFQTIIKGQKIAEIYSPELITAQRELLFIVENDNTNKLLLDAATEKLKLLGLTSLQINNLIQKKEVNNTVNIYSNSTGYVITDENSNASVTTSTPTSSSSSSGGMSDGMGSPTTSSSPSASTSTQATTSTLIREGTYVTTGQTLFNVVNVDALRIELDLPASKTTMVKPGDALTLDIGNGKEEANVNFVQPFYNEGQEFVKLRVNVSNSKALQIGQLVSATITTSGSESLWVPRESVLDLGSEKIVFVKDRNVLKPRVVNTGISSDGWIEIKSGLASMDEIAANAQYLVDSESFIKTTK